MQLAWLTDIHLNFVERQAKRLFYESLTDEWHAVLISGDIGERQDVQSHLREIADVLQRPIYFVLGNNDFYRSSISAVRESVSWMAAESEFLTYLTSSSVVELTPRTALIGHDGWADARLGDFAHSNVVLIPIQLPDRI